MIDYTTDLSGLQEHLANRNDSTAVRINRMLHMPDLTRTPASPIWHITQAVTKVSALAHAEEVVFREIVPVEKNFDLLGIAADHPSRRPTDTFYIDPDHVLRTQTTTMWPYYLQDPQVLKRLNEKGSVCAYSYGKVYRNDEIDRHHYPVFHQIDGLCLSRHSIKTFSTTDLADILIEIAKTIYGLNVNCRVSDDSFPFTDPSLQLEIKWNDQWLEVLGAGLVNPKVLQLLNLSPQEYNGWAFGFGLDRLAMIKMNIPDIRLFWSQDERVVRQFTGIDSLYREVSNYPAVDRDISFIVSRTTAQNSFHEIVRECGFSDDEDIIEEVTLLETYANEKKFGADRVSYTFRIRYRSHVRTVTNDEINTVQENVRTMTSGQLGAVLR